ncbi:MAG: hypothetical protein HC915_16415 [Anaerolineae bacterium]|nr:hypothetical protein [Anaerolineae bacterium]
MILEGLLTALTETAVFSTLLNTLRAERVAEDQDVLRAARPFVVAGLAAHLERPVLVITGRNDRAYNIAQQLPVWLPGAEISRFEEPTPMFYERAPWSEATRQARLHTLGLLMDGPAEGAPLLVISSARALMQKTLPRASFAWGRASYG